jgi:hypothetical protein
MQNVETRDATHSCHCFQSLSTRFKITAHHEAYGIFFVNWALHTNTQTHKHIYMYVLILPDSGLVPFLRFKASVLGGVISWDSSAGEGRFFTADDVQAGARIEFEFVVRNRDGSQVGVSPQIQVRNSHTTVYSRGPAHLLRRHSSRTTL